MEKLVFFLVSLALFPTDSNAWHTFTDDQIMAILPRVCPARNLLCPLPQYSKDPITHVWDREKILSSKAIQEFKAGKIGRSETVGFFKKEFCCTKPNCLKICSIFKKEEIDLIKKFPQNVKEIFALQLDGMEKFKDDVEKFLLHHRNDSNMRYPGEIENYFDFIAKNEDRILSLLRENKN